MQKLVYFEGNHQDFIVLAKKILENHLTLSVFAENK
jgi:hypothetical protein